MKRTVIGIIVGFLIINAMAPITISVETNEKTRNERSYLFSFNSYIDLEYDSSVLNEPLPSNETVIVPVTIKYWTDLPDNFLWFLPWQIRNRILFGSVIVPMQKIHLEVLNIPDWANIYFAQPDVLVQIPTMGTVMEVTTILLFNIKSGAPTESYIIGVKAECDAIKRINEYETQEFIEFTPG